VIDSLIDARDQTASGVESSSPYFLEQPVWFLFAIISAILIWAEEETADRTH
jgi:hypothetical protein